MGSRGTAPEEAGAGGYSSPQAHLVFQSPPSGSAMPPHIDGLSPPSVLPRKPHGVAKVTPAPILCCLVHVDGAEWDTSTSWLCLVQPRSVQEQEEDAGVTGVWARPPFLPSRGCLMAPPGSRDIFMVYLIEEFGRRMFLAPRE